MIRRHGHYIVETRSRLDRNNMAWCLKCGEDFCTASGRAATAWVFDKPCRGTWKKEMATINRLFDQAEKRQATLLKWMAFDQKLGASRSRPGAAQERQRRQIGSPGTPTKEKRGRTPPKRSYEAE